jgi:predicted metal-dependent phosphoesterase TrpH
MKYDLHTHTTESDGKYTPDELITQADIAGIDVLAITDHDTTTGLAKAYQATLNKNISLIPGVELSVCWGNRSFHIVGLKINPENNLLGDNLAEHKQQRELRAIKIGEQLDKCGIPYAYDGAKQLASDEAITRNHFARFLVNHGYAKNINDVFKRYMVKNKPGYVKTHWINMEDGINLINQSGGTAVLAHPLRYNLTGTWIRKLLTTFKQAGGLSIEIVTGNSTPNEVRIAADYARHFKLSGSVGSDFHGHENNGIHLGSLNKLPRDIAPVWESW